MTKVYRYEFESEFESLEIYDGPYTVDTNAPGMDDINTLQDEICNSHSSTKSPNHPGAYIDMPNFSCNHYCACLSIKELTDWFKGYNTRLKKLGFSLVEYEVKNYIESKSNRQCAFDCDDIINRTVLNI